MSKEIFKKIAGARASGGGNYIRDGEGRLVIKAIKLEKLYGGWTFIVEMLVDSSKSYSDMYQKDGKLLPGNVDGAALVQANPAGSSVSWVQPLDKFESAAGNVKAFILKLTGEEDVPDDKLEAAIEFFTSKTNPGRGMAIDYSTYRREIQKGKNAGELICLCKWETVKENGKEIIAARRGALDKKDAAEASVAKEG